MRHDAWRRDVAAYPLSDELFPRYSDVDIWQHLNNAALMSMHGESVHRALREVLGPDAWKAGEAAIACVSSSTDFLAEAYYPAPLTWAARVLGVGEQGLEISTALFQQGACVGLHNAVFSGWAEGRAVGLGPGREEALHLAGVRADEAHGGGAMSAPADIPSSRFPWRTTIKVRFGDSDAQRLASDAFLARCAEQMRVEFLNTLYGTRRDELGGMLVAHVSLHWRHRMPPGSVWEVGCGVAHLGGKSLAVRGAMFDSGTCVAVCDSVMVVIDRQSRRSAPLSDAARALLERYRLI